MELANRVSTFILVMGLALIGLFVLSIIAEDVQMILLVVGLILVALAGYLNVRFPGPQLPPAERFRLVKKKQPKSSQPQSIEPENQPEGRKNQPGEYGRRGGKKSSSR